MVDEDGAAAGVMLLSVSPTAFRMKAKAVRTRARIPKFTGVVKEMAVSAGSTSSAVTAAVVVKCSLRDIPMC